MTNKVPNIRFKGFTDDWEQRKLGEIADKVTKKNKDIVVDEVFTNSAEFGIISQRDFFDKEIANAENIGGYYIVEPNDFVYNPRISTTAPFGPIKRNKLERTGAMSPLYYVFRPHGIDLSYLEWYFQTTCWHAFMRVNGNSGARSDRFAITDKTFNKMLISVPQDIEEQRKVGTFLTELDHLITLHQRKCEQTKELKKFMLQKMFPKKGEKNPEIRFPGFTDDWEQRSLGNVAKITMGQSPNSENYTENPSDYILVQGNADMKDGRVVPRVWTTQVTKTADKGDLILSVRAPVGDIGKTDYDVVLGRGVAAIKGNEFLFQSLGRMKQNGYWTKLSTGSTFESINSNDIKEAQILLPSLEEQDKIGTFFTNIDSLITLHQRKCGQLKELKKFMLQNMFPKKG